MKCGLLGRKLSHSYSPQIHSLLADYSYGLFEKEPEELESFLKSGDWTGINVTVPYKKAVLPFLDELTPIASRLGAVNTVVRQDGKLIGHNTDYFGFQTMVSSCGVDIAGKKVLVMGSGGASCTAAAVLDELGAQVVVISRTGVNHYGNLHLHADATMIVNTTPVGMYPNTGITLVDLDQFPCLKGVLDVIYNPARTRLLLDAEKRGLVTMNGLLMLVAQAKEAAEWFLDKPIDDQFVTKIHQVLREQTENILLIGMPGCGKSTVGKLLAEITNRKFADADELIVSMAGKPIPQIFAETGEAGFRDFETRALAELCKQSGLVIATGGGCVTQDRNYPLLHQNGMIIWLKRDIKDLSTEGRPLSQRTPLEQMYHLRKPMYEGFADCVIDNSGTPEETAKNILEVLK